MSKMIKTTETDLKVKESTILAVEIGCFSFEKDSRYPWIDVYTVGDESKFFMTQIAEKVSEISTHKELKVFALNWFFENVEIVTNIL